MPKVWPRKNYSQKKNYINQKHKFNWTKWYLDILFKIIKNILIISLFSLKNILWRRCPTDKIFIKVNQQTGKSQRASWKQKTLDWYKRLQRLPFDLPSPCVRHFCLWDPFSKTFPRRLKNKARVLRSNGFCRQDLQKEP